MLKDLFKVIIERRSGTDQRGCVDNWDHRGWAIAMLIDSGLTAVSVPCIVIRTPQICAFGSSKRTQLQTHTCTHKHTRTHALARLQHLNNTEFYFDSTLSKPNLGIVSSRKWMNWCLRRQVSWDWYMTKHNKTRQSNSLFGIVYVSIIADFTKVIAWRFYVAFKQKLVRPTRLSHFNYLDARKRWVGRSQTTTRLLVCV